MKILHISNYYFPHIGGIEQVAQDCVNALAGTAEQRLFCFHTEKKDVYEEIDGCPVVRAGTFAKVASQSLSLRYGKLLKRQFREFMPEVVIFHYPNPFAAHYLLKILKKYPKCKLIVYWHLDITKQKILGKLFNGQTNRLLKRAEKVVATSPNYIDGSKFLPAYRGKCTVVPNCANSERTAVTERATRLAAEIRANNAGKILLFALGRHVPYKGMEYLVRASKLLGDGYKVFIGGEGELTQSLKALAAGDEKVEFLGKVDNELRVAYTVACDVFCFPSVTKNEAFGIALAEAMALGKPSVTFTIEGSGVNYVSIDGVTGLEVENANVEAYAKAIETLAADEALRLKYGQATKERAERLFTETVFRENIQSLIKEIS